MLKPTKSVKARRRHGMMQADLSSRLRPLVTIVEEKKPYSVSPWKPSAGSATSDEEEVEIDFLQFDDEEDEEDDSEWYRHEMQDFLSVYTQSVVSYSPADVPRRDSLGVLPSASSSDASQSFPPAPVASTSSVSKRLGRVSKALPPVPLQIQSRRPARVPSGPRPLPRINLPLDFTLNLEAEMRMIDFDSEDDEEHDPLALRVPGMCRDGDDRSCASSMSNLSVCLSEDDVESMFSRGTTVDGEDEIVFPLSMPTTPLDVEDPLFSPPLDTAGTFSSFSFATTTSASSYSVKSDESFDHRLSALSAFAAERRVTRMSYSLDEDYDHEYDDGHIPPNALKSKWSFSTLASVQDTKPSSPPPVSQSNLRFRNVFQHLNLKRLSIAPQSNPSASSARSPPRLKSSGVPKAPTSSRSRASASLFPISPRRGRSPVAGLSDFDEEDEDEDEEVLMEAGPLKRKPTPLMLLTRAS